LRIYSRETKRIGVSEIKGRKHEQEKKEKEKICAEMSGGFL